jgi:allantoinase
MSETLDLIVRGGHVVTPEGIQQADIAVSGSAISQVAPAIAESAESEIDATGRYIFPGFIDAHVHFNEPGRTDWEGLASGSAALAAGGATSFFDMPLNSEPPVLDAAALRTKRVLAEEKSCLDFGLWGGLTPLNLDKLTGLRDAGAIGLKAFMSASGIDSFPRVDERTLHEGMKRATKLGLLVAVHAEDETLGAKYTAQQKALGATDAAAWLASRPVEVELAAIEMALNLAGETRCALHIVHVSSPEGVALVSAARDNGVDVTAETCPHYLLLNASDVKRMGAVAKCAPPIRDERRRKALWAAVRDRQIHTIGSDHSPAPETMKTSPNFFEIWGGIAGGQHGTSLLLSECATTAVTDWPKLAAALAKNVAQRFRIGERKGSVAPGYDADFTIVENNGAQEITADELWTRHPISPYVGRHTKVRVTHTFVRGHAIYADKRLTNLPPPGRFLRPDYGT